MTLIENPEPRNRVITRTAIQQPIKSDLRLNMTAIRQSYFKAARQTSVGILMFGFSPETWDYPVTLGGVLRKYPKIRRRFNRWLKERKPQRACLTQDEWKWMLRQ